MNDAVILKCTEARPVVWLELSILPKRSPIWLPRLITDPNDEVILRGLGLKVNYLGDTLLADMGPNLEDFHNPKFELLPTQHIYFTDSHTASEKRSTANYFFADHLIQVKPASVLDENKVELLLCKYKLTMNYSGHGHPKREAVMVCYGKLPDIPTEWQSSSEYSKILAEFDRKQNITTLGSFLEAPWDTHLGRCNPIQQKLLEKFVEIKSGTKSEGAV